MSDNDEPEDRRTEGVRIIGAQEAAEAAARPDVVRRRSRREKRYGDRPDEPEAASDLPKITISTTETEGPADTDRFGSTPLVRPEDDAGGGDPRWADDDREPDPRAGFGHARILAAQDPDEDPSDEEQPHDPAPTTWAAEPEPNWAASDGPPVPGGVEEPGRVEELDDDATQQWSSSDFAQEWSTQDAEDDPAVPLSPTWDPEESRSEFGTFEPAAASAEPEDDSFVLPHWTEPPTGQVPRVIIGEDAPEPESLATYGSQPRWRDEGERDVVTGFDDLIDEEPGLGALREDDVEDAFFADQDYDDDGYLIEGDEDLEPYDEDYDDELPAPPPRRRAPSRRARSDDDGSGRGGDRDMVTAVGVGVALVAVGLVCFRLGSLPTAILATVVVTVAAWEYFSAVRSSGYNPATLLGMASVIGVMLAAFTSGLSAYPVVLGLSVIAGLLWYLWVAPGEGAVQNLGLTMLGVMWVGVLGSFATLFLGLGRILEDGDNAITSNPGIGVLIAAVIATVSHDIGAYFVGRFFGRTPLSAASPNKTQEGLAGGVLTSLVVTVGIVGIVGIEPIGADLPQTFVFALLCAIVAPLGDLAESFVKRDLAIKDMGSVLPGHGGVLDRFDGMLFVLPMAYFVTLLFDIWTGSGS